MANFSAKDVKLLREKTGVGMLDCKEALDQSNGNIERAIEILREKGIVKAAKKADRVAAEGIVLAKTKENKGVLLEVNSETDFVARNDGFKTFVNSVAETILDNSPKDMESLNNCKISGGSSTVAETVQEEILVLGENIKIRRFVLMEGVLASYIHGTGNIGVMVKFETDLAQKSEFLEYGKNIAMHIAAAYSKYLDSSKVPADILEKEKHILKQQLADSKKPDNIIQKIIEGKIKKFYEEFCLLDQKYVKDDELTIQKYTEKTAKELGGSIKIIDFVRMERGEGVQQNNSKSFAEEVSSMVNKG